MHTDEKHILSKLEQLKRSGPSEGSTLGALARTRKALLDARETKPETHSRKLTMKAKIAFGSGIAAVAAVAVIFLMSHEATPLSAAEQLNEVAKAGVAYKGWVHVKVEVTPPSDLSKIDKQVRIDARAIHVNTQDPTVVLDMQLSGARVVQYYNLSKKQMLVYSAANKIIGEQAFSATEAQQVYDEVCKLIDVNTMIAMLGQVQKFETKVVRDGKLDRYDLTPLKLGISAPAASQPASQTTVSISIWADPQTKLAQKLQANVSDGRKAMATWQYGKPEIKDIYDLGVPKDTKVLNETAASAPAISHER